MSREGKVVSFRPFPSPPSRLINSRRMTFDPVKDRDCFSSPLPPADQDSMKAAKKESNSQLKRRYSMVDLRSLAHSENSVSAGDWCLVCRELRERIKELEESYHRTPAS